MRAYVFSVFMIGNFTPPREDVWEENLRIYYAESWQDAEERAKQEAINNEIAYETNDGFLLTWKVHSVCLVNQLDLPIKEGEDIFYRSLTPSEASSLLGKMS